MAYKVDLPLFSFEDHTKDTLKV
ncbi:hypothetical protein AZE42_07265 [Rhizopogon vesiculosus]|uniref:Uncharacterized protein n=1 Tax=Rhizopogon vesiculosus TaxID=180088 RepID=A0A1J8QC03_9AGAM|nr:hypothetical protein AZE42_07265 [Rhizopogon vesiculosus]